MSGKQLYSAHGVYLLCYLTLLLCLWVLRTQTWFSHMLLIQLSRGTAGLMYTWVLPLWLGSAHSKISTVGSARPFRGTMIGCSSARPVLSKRTCDGATSSENDCP